MENFRLFVAEGDACYRRGLYGKAVHAYTKALEIKDDDRSVLLSRSKCYVALGKPKQAIDDANESIGRDSSFYRGIYQKAEALFASGDFEFALVNYYRAYLRRPDIMSYRLGVQKAEQAIKRAFGPLPDGVIHLLEDLEQTQSVVSDQDQKRDGKKNADSESPELATHQTRRLLGQLYPDQQFLQDLQHEAQGRKEAHIANTGLTYLKTRTEFWRQQVPLNVSQSTGSPRPPPPGLPARRGAKRRAYKPKPKPSASGHLRTSAKRVSVESSSSHQASPPRVTKRSTIARRSVGPKTPVRRQPPTVHRFVTESMNNIGSALTSGSIELALSFSHALLRRLSQADPAVLAYQPRPRVQAETHSVVGSLLVAQGKPKQALSSFRRALDLAEGEGDLTGQQRALRAMGRAHQRMGNASSAYATFSRLIPLLDDPALGFIRADAQFQCARCWFDRGNHVSASEAAAEAIMEFERVGRDRTGLDSDAPLRDAMPEGPDPAAQALSLFEEATPRQLYCDALCLRGRALQFEGRHSESREVLLLGLELAAAWSDPVALRATQSNLLALQE